MRSSRMLPPPWLGRAVTRGRQSPGEAAASQGRDGWPWSVLSKGEGRGPAAQAPLATPACGL